MNQQAAPTGSTKSQLKIALLQLHTAVFLAGFTAVLGKLITMPEISLVWWRMVFTILILVIFIQFNKASSSRALSFKQKGKAVGIGFIIGIHWLFFFGSVKYGNISIALVCLSAASFFSSLLEPVILRTRFSLVELGLGLLSLYGISLIFDFTDSHRTAIVLGLLAALFGALYGILNKKYTYSYEPVQLTYLEMIGAFILCNLALPVYYNIDGGLTFLPKGMDWLWIIILAGLCTVWALILQIKSLKHVSSFTLMLTYNLEPVYGIIMALLFFNEAETFKDTYLLGTGVIIFTVLFQVVRIKHQQKKRLKAEAQLM